MGVQVDYYLSVASPWTFLGSSRFIKMAGQYGAQVDVRPMDFGRILAASGGLPYQQRAPQRASYRRIDLARWSRRLGTPLLLEPKFYPVDRQPASLLVIATRDRFGADAALELTHAVLRGMWQEDRDIADADTLVSMADSCGLDGQALLEASRSPAIADAWEHDTACALEAQVFGAPTWVVDGERFWGQDRLDFLEERLAA